MMRKIINGITYAVILVVVGGVAVGYGAVRAGKLQPIRPYVVLSGSMEPSVPTGSVVVVQPNTSGYGVGEVITFSQKSGKDAVTHRINTIDNVDGVISYTTKGDANNQVDNSTVAKDQVVGKVIWTIPYLGFGIEYAKKPYGFILLVIVPATIIIYEELKNIGREMGKKVRRGKKHTEVAVTESKPVEISSLDEQTAPVPYSSWHWQATIPTSFGQGLSKYAPNIPLKLMGVGVTSVAEMPVSTQPARVVVKPDKKSVKWLGLVPTVAVVMLFVGVTGSFFADTEQTLANFLGAAADFDQQQRLFLANSMVINEVLPVASCKQGQTEGVFVELYNGSSDPVDLKDYTISDGIKDVGLVNSESTMVDSGKMVILAYSKAIFGTDKCFDDPGVPIVNLGNQIKLGNSKLLLKDTLGNVVDTVRWGQADGLIPLSDQSIERVPRGFDTATGSQFTPTDFVVTTQPSPGW